MREMRVAQKMKRKIFLHFSKMLLLVRGCFGAGIVWRKLENWHKAKNLKF